MRGHRVAGFVPEDAFSSLRVVKVVRELGLVTCERGVFGQGGPDFSVGGVPVGNCLDVDHMKEEVQVSVQVEVEREEQGTRRGTERTDAQATAHMDDHVDDITPTNTFLRHAV